MVSKYVDASPDRATDMPGGCDCVRCGRVFIGGPAHDLCGYCAAVNATINRIVRDVAEIERDPLPDQPHNEMRVTADELKAILDAHL
jgi:hypothetical protein